jgi:hypothetical protein
MARIKLTSPWFGISLTIICLGISGGCRCADSVCRSSHPPALCKDRLSQGAVTCDPCCGYHPTCWTAWPVCCRSCPPPDQFIPVPRKLLGNAPPAEGVGSNANDLEMVPMPEPQSEMGAPPEAKGPLSKVNQPPRAKAVEPLHKVKELPQAIPDGSLPKVKSPPKAKADEPLPKVKEPPTTKSVLPREEELHSIVPIKPAMDDADRDESDTGGWKKAPTPKPSGNNAGSNTKDVCCGSGGGKFFPTRDIYNMCLALLTPDYYAFPEIHQVAFGQKVDRSCDGQ